MDQKSTEHLVLDTAPNAAFRSIAEQALHSERISPDDALLLYGHAPPAWLGTLAHMIRKKKNGNTVFFNRNFHIEPTNVCVFTCHFCSYSRSYKNRENGWELSKSEILSRVEAYRDIPVTEVHIVGGVHPKLTLDFFCDLIRSIKEINPGLHIKAFTAVELDYMIRKAKLSYEDGLLKLKASGMDSIPGGGAEIFNESIRQKICADKCTADQWLTIHETAHRLGMRSNATMLYGHIEQFEHRIDHMERLRNLQDRTRGFQAFIPLKFRNKNNDMSHVSETNLIEDLKNYAIARIFLDNFPHIKTYWPMIGKQTAQASLSWGVDDIDGTIDDSTKIYSMAGAEEQNPAMTTRELVELIRHAGFAPVERDTLYNVVNDFLSSETMTV